jgi:hypothetical protein
LEVDEVDMKILEPETILEAVSLEYDEYELDMFSVLGVEITKFEAPGILEVVYILDNYPYRFFVGGVVLSAQFKVKKRLECCQNMYLDGCDWVREEDALGEAVVKQGVCDSLFRKYCSDPMNKTDVRCGCLNSDLNDITLTKCYEKGCDHPSAYQTREFINAQCPKGCSAVNKLTDIEQSSVAQMLIQECKFKEALGIEEYANKQQDHEKDIKQCHNGVCYGGEGKTVGGEKAKDEKDKENQNQNNKFQGSSSPPDPGPAEEDARQQMMMYGFIGVIVFAVIILLVMIM